MKRALLIVGCGDVALRNVPLLADRYRLLGLCRKPENHHWLRMHGVTPVAGDLDQAESLFRLAGIAHTILHLVPPPGEGETDPRTTRLLAALSGTYQPRQYSQRRSVSHPIRGGILPQRLIYISTSGVYGDCHGEWVSETRAVNPQTGRAVRRVDAERQIRAWGLRNHVHTAILRVPGIYAGDRLPVARLKQGTPAILPEEDGYTNHIHADDLARIIVAALRYAKPGRIYHTCDDSRLKMGEYFDLVADCTGLPRPLRIARNGAEQHISSAMLSFMCESRRLANARMKQELQVRLRYPTAADGVRASAAIITKSR